MYELSLQAQPHALWTFAELWSFRAVQPMWLRGAPLCVQRGVGAECPLIASESMDCWRGEPGDGVPMPPHHALIPFDAIFIRLHVHGID